MATRHVQRRCCSILSTSARIERASSSSAVPNDIRNRRPLSTANLSLPPFSLPGLDLGSIFDFAKDTKRTVQEPFLEEETDDYRLCPGPSNTLHSSPPPHSACQVLLTMLTSANPDYVTAAQVRDDLVRMNIPIKPSHVYARTAIDLLRRYHRKGDEADAKGFLTWWVHTPPPRRRMEREAREVVRVLLERPEDLGLMKAWIMVLQSMDGVQYAGTEILAHFARFARREEVDELMRTLDVCHPGGRANRLNAIAIAYGLCGRVQEMHHTLGLAWSDSGLTRVSRDTYSILLHDLARSQRGWFDLKPLAVRDYRNIAMPKILTPLVANELPRLPEPPERSAIAQGVRLLRARMLSTSPLSAGYTAVLLSHYFAVTSDQTQQPLPSLLFNRILRLAPREAWDAPVGEWAAALMVYYRNRGDPRAALYVYKQFFLMTGVPRVLIEKELAMDTKQPPNMWCEIERLRGRKIVPTKEHTTLVWHLLIQLAGGNLPALDELYRAFLKICTPKPAGPISSVKPTVEFILPPTLAPDAVAFVPFVTEYCKRGIPNSAIAILGDMRALGITPILHQWNGLAWAFSIRGDWEQAKRVLEAMEATAAKEREGTVVVGSVGVDTHGENSAGVSVDAEDGGVEGGASGGIDTHSGSKQKKGRLGEYYHNAPNPAGAVTDIPSANLVTYNGVMQGLIRRWKLKEARLVEEKMMRAGYVRGANPTTERILRELATREVWKAENDARYAPKPQGASNVSLPLQSAPGGTRNIDDLERAFPTEFEVQAQQ
ncbi:hypothetical protein BOTBODRAFT_32465 [Botryobasidium botryosum FD-172 SS1]|uniref:Pentacotripeptide-repeat region of PRORP domain-containing protein n=1 Tax=Botryobasidium botryosum (strain FD-172 SS1) TaxID=930990 RepID=A0A067MFW7_BOTB1|nr:hypothetical protein BOTBODRAFT_32465 [Botryobasidium botryosum FD-172 SS1]